MLPIYVDLDDVLSETTLASSKLLKREYGREVGLEQITSFNFQEAFGLSQEEYDYFFELIHRPEEILGLDPVDGAIEVLKNWAAQGYEIAIVTGRLTSTYETSLEWLSSHKVPYDSFIMVDKYSRPDTDHRIAISMNDLSSMKFGLAVEDSLSMAEYISQTMDTRVALFDRPWNRAQSIFDKIERCATWDRIGLQLIHE